jgi:hypothetical protein
MFRCARERARAARRVLPVVVTFAVVSGGLIGASATTATAAAYSPTAASWCSVHGSALGAWAPTNPPLPICGPGPAYGGTWSTVSIPGPYGSLDHYYNATPGFQCVELADRFLAVADGFPAVMANGSEVVMNYHAAYPKTTVILNGSAGAVNHAPVAGNVLSLSTVPSFYDPSSGHVAVVVASHVNAAGNGTVEVAQQNVSPADYLYTLDLVAWRLVDPAEPANAEFQYRYAEWLEVPATHGSTSLSTLPQLLRASAVAHEVAQFTSIARGAAQGASQLGRAASR